MTTLTRVRRCPPLRRLFQWEEQATSEAHLTFPRRAACPRLRPLRYALWVGAVRTADALVPSPSLK